MFINHHIDANMTKSNAILTVQGSKFTFDIKKKALLGCENDSMLTQTYQKLHPLHNPNPHSDASKRKRSISIDKTFTTETKMQLHATT